MKLLVAVKSSDIRLVNKSLRWVGRTGYTLRVFVKGVDWEPYVDRLKEISENHYLNLTAKNLVTDYDPEVYARENGFDLLLEIPEARPAFRQKRVRINLDEEVMEFAKAVGAARKTLSENHELSSVTLRRGVTMRRVYDNGKVKEAIKQEA